MYRFMKGPRNEIHLFSFDCCITKQNGIMNMAGNSGEKHFIKTSKTTEFIGLET